MSDFFFFFNDTATTEIYTLSLHDALPISPRECGPEERRPLPGDRRAAGTPRRPRRSAGTRGTAATHRVGSATRDRKSTRLNSSHVRISYAVFCLKKKNPPTLPFSFPPHTE